MIYLATSKPFRSGVIPSWTPRNMEALIMLACIITGARIYQVIRPLV